MRHRNVVRSWIRYGGDDYDGYGDGDDYGGGGNYGDPAEHLEGVLELDAKTFDKVCTGVFAMR